MVIQNSFLLEHSSDTGPKALMKAGEAAQWGHRQQLTLGEGAGRRSSAHRGLPAVEEKGCDSNEATTACRFCNITSAYLLSVRQKVLEP